MELEASGSESHPYRMKFTPEEAAAVKAAYVEEKNMRVGKGNVSAVSDFDVAVAKWEEGKGQTALFCSYESLAEKLESFATRTEEVMIDIAGDSAIPNFLNDYTMIRYELGQRALKLVEEVREKGRGFYLPLPDPDELDIDAELRHFRNGLEEEAD